MACLANTIPTLVAAFSCLFLPEHQEGTPKHFKPLALLGAEKVGFSSSCGLRCVGHAVHPLAEVLKMIESTFACGRVGDIM